jgi:glycosyltransferase involved in cell wall biosynthesis
MFPHGVSLIICSFNGATRLPETLKHIALQRVPLTISWEVIVVDNSSTDHTGEIANKEWQKYNRQDTDFRVVNQPIAGLTFARHIGIENAKYGYIIFCDDDNWLDENYISNALSVMDKDDRIGALGSQSVLVSNSTPPKWFLKNQGNFAIGKQSLIEGDITESRGWVWGAGAVYRKDAVLLTFQTPYHLSGRKGNSLSTGEDVELCMKLLKLGYKIYYSNNLVLKHYMPDSRFDIHKFWQLCLANGKASVYLDLYKGKQIKKHFLAWNTQWLFEILVGCLTKMKIFKSYAWDKKMDKLEFHINMKTVNGRISELKKAKYMYDHLIKKNEN